MSEQAEVPEGAERVTATGIYLRRQDGAVASWSSLYSRWQVPDDCNYWEAFHQAKPLAGDPVNHPDHYASGDIECIDAIRAALTDEEFRGYCKGNMLKYVWRERKKGGVESLKKCGWYLDRLIQEMET